MPELDQLNEVPVLEALLIQHVVGGSDREQIQAAILAAARTTG